VNETFVGSTGPATLDVTVSGTGITFSLDLGGFVFGVGDPPPIVATGTANPDGTITLDGVAGNAVYGDVSGDSETDGSFGIDLMDASNGNFALVEIRGTWTPTELRSRYDIYPSVGGPVFATGRFELDFVPPPCYCDLDGNTLLNVDDVGAFANGFLSTDLGVADCDENGVLNVDDIGCFVACFLGGCG
jgi:hypothetical protein